MTTKSDGEEVQVNARARLVGLILLMLVVLGLGMWVNRTRSKQATAPATSQTTSTELPYVPADGINLTLARIATDMGPVTRISFTPDNKFMLAAVLTGEIYAFKRIGAAWERQAEPVIKINTAFPGFPPEENGLAGMALAADYDQSRELFLTYAYRAGETDYRNRVARVTLVEQDGQLIGEQLTDIFEANTPAGTSHQIQGIIGVRVQNVSHLLFLVGEGFKAVRARDLTKEAGKLMLIQRDGRDPLGPRPFPKQPKLQAIGIRNAPDLAVNPFDAEQRLAIVDTGPDQFDRFIYGNFFDFKTGKRVTGIDLAWDETLTSLQKDVPDPNTTGKPNTILYRWDPTHTATNIVFHSGKGSIPASTEIETSVLVSLFGRTGQTGKDLPGREIWLGRLTTAENPTVTWSPFIVRSSTGVDIIGHPLALARDPLTNDLVFADIIEGSIYSATLAE